jgi:outer membrane protein assembly factor BamA
MRPLRFKLLWLILICAMALIAQRSSAPPLVRSWTIREVGRFKKIPTATLREKMAQRGVLFGVNEPFDQDKVDGTILLLKQVYKDAGVVVLVRSVTIPAGPNAVKIEYSVNKQ